MWITIHAESFFHCTQCGYINNQIDITSMMWSTVYNSSLHTRRRTTSSYEILSCLLGDNGKRRCSSCHESHTFTTSTRFHRPPLFVCLEILAKDNRFPSIDVNQTIEFSIGDISYSWRLFGLIYLGGGHFTAHFIQTNGSVWYHNGIVTGSECRQHAVNMTQLAAADRQKLCMMLYMRAA